MSESKTQSAPAATLTIGLLLLWISTTALILAACRPFLSEPILADDATVEAHQISRQQHRLALITLPTIAPIWGIALSGCVAGVLRTFRFGAVFPTQPGHWLLLIVGSAVLALLPLRAILPFDHWRGVRTFIIWTSFIAAVLLPTTFAFVAALRLKEPLHWRLLIAALAASLLSMTCGLLWSELAFEYWKRAEMIGTALAGLGVLAFLFSILGLLIAPLIDLILRERLDALHCMGISLVPLHLVWLVVWITLGSWT